MDDKNLEFVIFCIEGLSERLERNADEVYRLLKNDTDIIDSYIIPCYEALHSQSKKYIIDDLIEVLNMKGVLK